MSKDFQPGDKVAWNSRNGKTHGTVEKKVSAIACVAGHTAKASSDDPQFVVKSAKSGKKAIHKPTSLKKQ